MINTFYKKKKTMKRLLLLLLVTACQTTNPPDLHLDDTAFPSSTVSSAFSSRSTSFGPTVEASKTTSTPSPSASTGEPTEKWETLADMSVLPGTWIHHTIGDSHPKHKLNEGGVRVVFIKGQAGSKTPWNLRFHAPKPGHTGSATVSGGCGFYEEVHDGTWRTAFCKGYGMKLVKGLELKLTIDHNSTRSKLRIKIGDLLEAVLVKQ